MPTDIRVISDTHGLLRPQAEAALEGADVIIHAGDVGRPEILDALQVIAPTHAVRGNVDGGDWADALPHTLTIEIDGAVIYMIHDRDDLSSNPPPPNCAAIIYGHSHKPSIEHIDGVLYLNPGSAGPRRFSVPVTLARLTIRNGAPSAEIIDLGFEGH